MTRRLVAAGSFCEDPGGTMPAPFGDLSAGATLGRYELLLPIAQGGMAQVWAARLKGSRGFSKTVAIKTMLPALSADVRFERMFLSEAELAARIKHPNVCEILDLGEAEGVLYLVMEWIDGESLVTLSVDCEEAGRKVPYEVCARIGLDAARGLHAAHELRDEGALIGVVHRDVSPHNILVTPEGMVKIVDFGVAKAVSRADHQATVSGHLKGKVQYMSPEQAYCQEIDRRADVFGLGVVLYHLTTGVHPFRTDNDLATLARIASPDPVRSPSSIVPGFPPSLARVLDKALAKDAAGRHATMTELAAELEEVIAELGREGHAVTLEAFAREVLSARAEERAARLKAASRAADERAATAAKIVDEASGPPVMTLSSPARAGEPQRREPAGRSLRGVIAGAVLGVGVGLGVAGALWARLPLREGGKKAAGAGVEAAAMVPSVVETAKPADAPRPSAEPSAAPAASATAPTTASAARPAPRPIAPAKPKPAAGATPPSTLRTPGF